MRNTIVRCICIALLGLLALPGMANAQTAAYTNAPANLRAGPAEDYPLVAQIPEDTMVSVIGCVSDYTWCDVALPGLRGWIYAGLLDYPYQGGYEPLLDYGADLGFPVVVFAIGPYWDNFYRDRPWFHDRDRFMHHRAEPRLGPGGVPPGRGHPQIGEPMPGGVAPGVGGRPGEHGGHEGHEGHDARPSATRGGWNGAIRTPAPAPMPQSGGNMRAPGPPAVMHAPNPSAQMHAPNPPAVMHAPAPNGGAVVVMPPPGHQGGGGGERGSFGGRQGGGGGGGGAHGGEFRHE
ncbi:peptide-binding protein [Burkholderia sp. Bp8963]|uniref:SH3 domain-containing protein n=1 Tax=Burkholderia sp. Bp8963 TaxID=2184547 RepID=UPI000F59AD09|nr:SH3 domain-containing protein [Burkholderia sp. Bp8963]RQS74548.1 peptide-binding protein [Burkholderia sp. Bp8963]